jgi:indoleamine 2,3-dioxygenase
MDQTTDVPALDELAAYDVSPRSGFVPEVDPLTNMPEAFAGVERIAVELPGLLRGRRVRDWITGMSEPDIGLAATPHERERLFLALCVLTNAWVWGGPEPDLAIPPQLARPVSALARQLGRQPIVHHASMCLWNWRRIDPDAPVSADNTDLILRFLGGTDETWFFTSTLDVELAGAAPLNELVLAARASSRDDADQAERHLAAAATAMPAINLALERVRDWCDPYVFYTRTRPYFTGWPEPGAVYRGVSDQPLMLAGGSAGQSALIQAFDAALGIVHQGPTGNFLAEMRRYMPEKHRRFLSDLGRTSRLRKMAEAATSPAFRDAFNVLIAELDQFRRRHMGLAMDYVVKPSGGAASLGTGGTDFTVFLREARLGTARSKLG